MFFIPLNQIESVELVIHALRAAGGQGDCSVCPVRKVCTQQCLAIAGVIEKMALEGTLPNLDPGPEEPPDPPEKSPTAGGGSGFLKVIK